MARQTETPDEARIPVSVLTGFLGSGKTTILNHLVRHSAFDRTLVLINEFGEIGIDHDLVAPAGEDTVLELSNGCLCCTIRGDLVRTLSAAPGRFSRNGRCWFDRVVIETTGLADPAPILRTLMTDAALARLYRLDGVVTVIDAFNGLSTLEAHEEALKQAAVADRLVITKADIASPEAVTELRAQLSRITPGTPQILASNGILDPVRILDAGLYNPATKSADVRRWLAEEADHDHGHHPAHGLDVNRHGPDIRAVSFIHDEPLDPDTFTSWIGTLMALASEDFLRTKGIVNIAGLNGPVVIHGVQHLFHPAVELPRWPSSDRRTRVVFVTRGIDEASLRKTLDIFTARDCENGVEAGRILGR